MAASLLGTTGNWGIPQDQAGILITDLSFDFSNQEKAVLDKGGEVIGLSLFQEKVEIKLSGLVAKDWPFAGKIGRCAHTGQRNGIPTSTPGNPQQPRAAAVSGLEYHTPSRPILEPRNGGPVAANLESNYLSKKFLAVGEGISGRITSDSKPCSVFAK